MAGKLVRRARNFLLGAAAITIAALIVELLLSFLIYGIDNGAVYDAFWQIVGFTSLLGIAEMSLLLIIGSVEMVMKNQK